MPCYSLFSTLFVSFLVLLLFHCLQYNDRRGWTELNGTDAGGYRNAGLDRGEGGSTYVSCYFLSSALFISSSHSSSFHCLQYSNRQGWAERGGTDAGMDSNTRQDRGAGQREEEVEERAEEGSAGD